jgi:hypothetical protein
MATISTTLILETSVVIVEPLKDPIRLNLQRLSSLLNLNH